QSRREQEAFLFLHPKRGFILLRVIMGKIAATVVDESRVSDGSGFVCFASRTPRALGVLHFCHTQKTVRPFKGGVRPEIWTFRTTEHRILSPLAASSFRQNP